LCLKTVSTLGRCIRSLSADNNPIG
jgi:hypothetical protein